MEFQLRDYRIKSGEMSEWLDEWRTKDLSFKGKIWVQSHRCLDSNRRISFPLDTKL